MRTLPAVQRSSCAVISARVQQRLNGSKCAVGTMGCAVCALLQHFKAMKTHGFRRAQRTM